MKLKDKIAIVTGSASSTGIGRTCALNFAKEGADVVVCDINYEGVEERAREIEQLGRKSLALNTDITRASDVSHLIETTISTFGKIDILVNNAGIREKMTPIQDLTVEEWDAVFDVNVKGVFLCTKYVVPHMIRQGRGKIINLASMTGVVGIPNYAPYCASKGAIVNLTRELAMELAPHKINVNAIGPGPIVTEMIKSTLDDKEFMEKIVMPNIPLGRLGIPEDIAAVAVFLASDESEFINGQTIFTDGGWLAH